MYITANMIFGLSGNRDFLRDSNPDMTGEITGDMTPENDLVCLKSGDFYPTKILW